jgi:hypothetical protein
MKYFLSIISMMIFSISISSAQSDAISKYFDKYMDDERFDMVYISPKMFQLAAKIDLEDADPEIQEILAELKGLRILSADTNAAQFYKEAVEKIDVSDFEELLTARGDGENVSIMVKDQGDIVNELLMLVGGSDEFILMSFVGNIDLNKVGKLGKMLDIHGIEHLEKIEKH